MHRILPIFDLNEEKTNAKRDLLVMTSLTLELVFLPFSSSSFLLSAVDEDTHLE